MRNRNCWVVGVVTLGFLSGACNREPTPATSTETVAAPADTPAASQVGARFGLIEEGAKASIGAPAPDFRLQDVNGQTISLSQYKGKTVVLEWFNPGCPFVQRSHTVGSLIDTASRHAKDGVVWLAINSGAPGKQGHGVEANKEAASTYSLRHPVLLDEAGTVGKAYGAARTPHMFVIDAQGVLVYRGAIDNSPDAERKSPEGGTLVNYVDAALADLAKGSKVQTSETEAYGCGVKYASQ